MPEEKQDPASTQMFRAFVDRGEPQGGRRTLPAVLLLVAAIVVAVVTVVLIVN